MSSLTAKAVEGYLDNLQFSNALSEIWKFISRTNKYIDETMPWALAKDEAKQDRLAAVLYNLCEAIRIISVFIEPFMPDTAAEIRKQTGIPTDVTSWDSVYTFGLLPRGFRVAKGPSIFPRLDLEKELNELAGDDTQPHAAAAAPEGIAQISIEDFSKVELRVAKIKACEKVEKSNKLLKLTLDVGGEERQVASGIAKWYSPDDLLGKNVILVSNLKPAKLFGISSNGMILAADVSNDAASVIFVDGMVPSGAKIR
jgi:methionyl-tRNA synthetase